MSMESDPTIASSTWIGKELWLEIFKKLPIESLCQFRCVSKSWNSLISSSYFVQSFTSSITPVNRKSYLRLNFRERNHNSYAVYIPQGNLVEHFRSKLHFPFQFRDFTFVDVIHGVVCVSYSVNSSFDSTILWNPKIHKYVVLPSLPFPLDLGTAKAESDDVVDFDSTTLFNSNAIGFGFGKSKNEFLVVRIWIPSCSIEWNRELPPPTFEVYSAEKGIWRISTVHQINIKSCEFNTCGSRASRTGCFLNGTIHWLVSTLNEQDGGRIYSVLMFDCETEEFTTMELSEEIHQNEMTSISQLRLKTELLEYDGKLSVLLYSCFTWQRQIELWVMEEYGVATSWKKLFRIPDGLELEYENDERLIYQALVGKLAPDSPSRWIKLSWNVERFDEILSDHVYDESLFLMDDPSARSYTKEEIVQI